MSEYHAAVALASLDPAFLSDKRQHASALFDFYVKHLPNVPDLILPPLVPDPTLLPVMLPSAAAVHAVELAFEREDIETRRWYAPLLHLRGEFGKRRLPGTSYAASEEVARRMIGLPFHGFVTEADVIKVCDTIREALA